jgi:hypothetical protein
MFDVSPIDLKPPSSQISQIKDSGVGSLRRSAGWVMSCRSGICPKPYEDVPTEFGDKQSQVLSYSLL